MEFGVTTSIAFKGSAIARSAISGYMYATGHASRNNLLICNVVDMAVSAISIRAIGKEQQSTWRWEDAQKHKEPDDDHPFVKRFTFLKPCNDFFTRFNDAGAFATITSRILGIFSAVGVNYICSRKLSNTGFFMALNLSSFLAAQAGLHVINRYYPKEIEREHIYWT